MSLRRRIARWLVPLPTIEDAGAAVQMVLGDRGSGKTLALMEWLCEGEKRPTYPGWSRIVVVMDEHEAHRLRTRVLPDLAPGQDVYRWIFTVADMEALRPRLRDVAVAFDNLDLILVRLLGFQPDIVTMTATLKGD